MGLVVKFPANMEERFNVALRDYNAKEVNKAYHLKPEDIGDDDIIEGLMCVNYYFDLYPSTYNEFFNWLDDVQQVMGINVTFRYTNTKKEAYTGYSKGLFRHLWLKLV